MTEFGSTLRLAREAKGLTQAQIAEITHMAPTTVAELEDENFGRIAAPIYGRGFVKLYCQAVGIDPKPLVEEFMAIYNGERSSGIRERKPVIAAKPPEPPPPPPPPIEPEPSPAPEPYTPAPVAGPEPVQPELSDSSKPIASALPEPVASEPPKPAKVALPEAESQVSRYAAPMRMEPRTPSIPPAFWRICALVAVAILLFWGIIVGIRSLYRATTSETPPVAVDDVTVKQPEALQPSARPQDKSAAKEETPRRDAINIKREPQKIPSLYID